MGAIIENLDRLREETSTLQVSAETANRIGRAVERVVNGWCANVLVGGTRGVGKTTLLNALESELETVQPVNDGTALVVRANCTPEMRCTDLFRALLKRCGQPAPKRQSVHFLGHRLREAFDEYESVILLVDDIEHVSNIEHFLDFLRPSPTNSTETTIGAVMTYADATLLDDVDSRTIDHLRLESHVLAAHLSMNARPCSRGGLTGDLIQTV